MTPRPNILAQWLFARCGWQLAIKLPPEPRAVILVYPHTSNWDFWWGILALWASGIQMTWLGKHTIFVGPLKTLLQRWGGIPVDRKAATGFVETIASTLRESEEMLLVIAPEGTRRHLDRWKSGFYRIALAADVPIGIGYIDYATRRVGISEYFRLSGNQTADMARIAEAYKNFVAYDPAKASPVRLNTPR